MAQGEIRIGDKGTIIECTIKDQDGVVVNISTINSASYLLRKPDGTGLTVSAVFVTDGTDGKLKYTITSATFLDVAGDWQLQVALAFPTTEWKSDIKNFMVHPNLPGAGT
jgi:hypothetical protein